MTVPTQDITSGPYTGNGIADTFAYDFSITDKNDLRVIQTDAAGNQTVLAVDADYTVTGVGNEAGGDVITTSPLPSNYKLFIRSDISPTQLTDFESQGAFFPDIHETAFDKLTRLIQQLEYTSGRSFRIDPDIEFDENIVLAVTAANRANRILGFDEDGNVRLFTPNETGLASVVVSVYDVAAGQTVVPVAAYEPNTQTQLYFLNSAPVFEKEGALTETNATTVTLANAPSQDSKLVVLTLPFNNIGTADSANISHEGNNLRDEVNARVPTVATLGELKGVLAPANGDQRILDGYFWEFVSGDYTAEVAADPLSGVYAASNHVGAAAGVWRRVFDGVCIKPEWFSDDDTVAINAAQVLSKDRFVIVYEPGKTYTVTTLDAVEHTIHRAEHFSHDENGTYTKPRIFLADNTNDDLFKYQSLNSGWIIFVGMYIDGNKANQTAGNGLRLSHQRAILYKCQIVNCKVNGVLLEDNGSALVENKITHCFIGYNGGNGIRNDGTNNTDHHITENEIFWNDGRGLYSSVSTFNWQIRLNHFYANGLESIRLEKAHDTKVQLNKSDNVGRLATYNLAGIYLNVAEAVNGNQVQGNVSRGGRFIEATGFDFAGIEINISSGFNAVTQVDNNLIVGMRNAAGTGFLPARSTALKTTGAGVISGSLHDNKIMHCDVLEDYNYEFVESYNNTLLVNSGSAATTVQQQRTNHSSVIYNNKKTDGTRRKVSYEDFSALPTTGTWARNDIVYFKNPERGGYVGGICVASGTPGTWVGFGQNGYRSAANDPVTGGITPRFVGEEYLETTTPRWYKSTGATSADWVALN